MAKIIIPFNNKEYSIDESVFSAASAALKSHLSTVMNGSGATVNFDGVTYNVDSAKLSAATSDFITHLGTVAGNGKKIVIGGVEYNVDSAKMAGAISEIEAVLGNLYSGESGGSEGESHNGVIPEGAFYGNLNTYQFYDVMPETVSEGDIYIYGDYVYQYSPSFDGWEVALATAETGITSFLPDYPVTDRNQTSYGAILSNINGKPIVSINYLFAGCESLTSVPAIPISVTTIGRSAFDNCLSLTDITIPNSVTYIDALAFYRCRSLIQIPLHDGITNIGVEAFRECSSVTDVVIPNSVNQIDSNAFSGCTELISVRIPDSFRNIPEGLFFECTSLTNIVFEGTKSQWVGKYFGDDWCAYVPATEVICSDGSVEL